MKKLSIIKGFTLIELMVVVAIITVLAVMGLRFYSGQVDKAKIAVIKANVSTIQFFIQAELLERPATDLDTPTKLSSVVFSAAGIHNPVAGNVQDACPADEAAAAAGEVWVTSSDDVFSINGRNTDDTGDVFANSLKAMK